MEPRSSLRTSAGRVAREARRRLSEARAGSEARPTTDQKARAGEPSAALPGAEPARRPKPPRTAILVVNGFDRHGRWGAFNEEEAREYPWIEVCLQQIERHSRTSSYEILVWDNTWMPEHRALLEKHPKVRMFSAAEEGTDVRHGASLDNLVKKVRPRTEFIITLDTDSFPIRDGWIENLTGRLTDDVLVSGVWRDEMLPQKPAFIHPCCLAIRKRTLRELGAKFTVGSSADVAHSITLAVEECGARAGKLRRSNQWSPHFLMGAVYGDLIYHQGAGSRAPMFSAKTDSANDEAVRLTLRDAAFSDLDGLLDALAGNVAPESVAALDPITSPTAPADPVGDPVSDPVSDPVGDPVGDPVSDPVSDPEPAAQE